MFVERGPHQLLASGLNASVVWELVQIDSSGAHGQKPDIIEVSEVEALSPENRVTYDTWEAAQPKAASAEPSKPVENTRDSETIALLNLSGPLTKLAKEPVSVGKILVIERDDIRQLCRSELPPRPINRAEHQSRSVLGSHSR